MTSDSFWMSIAVQVSKESKCVSRQVGAILVRNGSIISSGVNGSNPGSLNCCENFVNYDPATQREDHHKWSRTHEHHAETNLFGKVIQNQTEISGSTLYVTLQPCEACSSQIITSGIKRVVFLSYYDKSSDDSIQNMIHAGIEVVHLHQYEDSS